MLICSLDLGNLLIMVRFSGGNRALCVSEFWKNNNSAIIVYLCSLGTEPRSETRFTCICKLKTYQIFCLDTVILVVNFYRVRVCFMLIEMFRHLVHGVGNSFTTTLK